MTIKQTSLQMIDEELNKMKEKIKIAEEEYIDLKKINDQLKWNSPLYDRMQMEYWESLSNVYRTRGERKFLLELKGVIIEEQKQEISKPILAKEQI